MRYLFGLILVLALAAGGAWLVAGRMTSPAIEISKPDKFVGTASPLDVSVSSPNNELSALRIVFEQDGNQTPLYAMDQPGEVKTKQDGERILLSGEIGKKTVPQLKAGAARIVVTAARPVLYGVRTLQSTATRDVQVRLERPRVSVISTHHYVNLGGSEMVVYRVTPDDVESGVVVGDVEYPGYPASGITVEACPSDASSS